MTNPWNTAGLLEHFNQITGRPRTDAVTDAEKITLLGKAQEEVIRDLAAVAPHVLYPKVATSAMPQMVTTDQKVFTFGADDDDDPIVPFGRVQIFRNLTDIPDRPLVEDVDFVNEGSQIRLPRNRTYSGTLYWRGIR